LPEAGELHLRVDLQPLGRRPVPIVHGEATFEGQSWEILARPGRMWARPRPEMPPETGPEPVPMPEPMPVGEPVEVAPAGTVEEGF
jgi:hypothetical protein